MRQFGKFADVNSFIFACIDNAVNYALDFFNFFKQCFVKWVII